MALLAAGALALTGCATNEGPAGTAGPGNATGTGGPALSGTLTGKGASSMKAAQDAWRAAFQTANNGVTVNYSPDGSGAGREAFVGGAVQFAGSDRPFKDEEMGAGKFKTCATDSNALNLPVYISPIAVLYQVEGVKDLQLDAATLAGIFAGKITTWNDPTIAALNPGAQLPAAAITPVHRADDSGTTENFTEYLHQAAPTVWTEDPDGVWPASFKGEAAQGTAGVVAAVKGGRNTIGYADESQAGELSIAKVKVGEEYLGPTAEAAAAIVDKSEKVAGRGEHDYALKLNRTAAGAYPIVLVSYALVCEKYPDAGQAALVKSYVGFIASDQGQKVSAEQAGSAPLSAEMATKVKAAIESIQ